MIFLNPITLPQALPQSVYDSILAVLPQTQCTQCGYEGCAPYAQAIADGLADINRCPPGGDAGVAQLARLMGTTIKPIDPECGASKPRHIAVIDLNRCIGCTLCISACPVDAIVGAPKAMHQVINRACTGCDLCLAPCPVDCISMQRIEGLLEWTASDALSAKIAHEARNARLIQANIDSSTRSDSRPLVAAVPAHLPPIAVVDTKAKQTAIASALAAARARRNQSKPLNLPT